MPDVEYELWNTEQLECVQPDKWAVMHSEHDLAARKALQLALQGERVYTAAIDGTLYFALELSKEQLLALLTTGPSCSEGPTPAECELLRVLDEKVSASAAAGE